MKRLALVFAAFLLMILAACGNGDGGSDASNAEGSNDTEATEEDASEEEATDESEDDAAASISGEVAIDGSSTVFPIMEAVSEEYAKENPDVQAPIGVSGSGGGFEKFINGETDISNASRPIKEEEIAALEEAGIEYTEFEIAYDGLSVVVNNENDWVDQLSVEELQTMWLADGATTWADVREGFPEEPIEFYSPGTDSGTYDYWNEVILEENPMRKDAVLSEDDNTLVQGVIGNKNAIGYFGYAYYIENSDNLKVVPIVNEAGEAVEPSEDTIRSGDYNPLSRPLFFYVKNSSLQEKPQVLDYVKFALGNAKTLAGEVGYVGLPDEEYDTAIEKVDEIAGQ
ncbi:PstS family phosphate ABC transporter substrate-binding protein [Bacillaceae bacterium SIJ1]|uniref:PstS family phosphate ABC transporter substrate-binding protein n=1 Tax=Litoribacterium kuwaitense TaxID=1398745 RepID=UPI0013EB03CC|nr:PstS family phosphate ABC transporter substrate-binding protein [Litoribacterium kuwaitense]NGP46364.1 PstS family phosphate ABC transporter substrate-binding protein [Litoribacterium kuwaitense]